MTVQQIKEAVEARPFRAFTLHLPGGRNAHVPHEDFISIHPDGRTVVVHLQKGGSRILDTRLVTELEFAGIAV